MLKNLSKFLGVVILCIFLSDLLLLALDVDLMAILLYDWGALLIIGALMFLEGFSKK